MDKASLSLVIDFIKGDCKIWSLMRFCNRSEPDYCSVCCNEEELEIDEHLLCKCLFEVENAWQGLNPAFFKGLNPVSRADIKALHRFINGLRRLRRARVLSL